MVVFIYTLLLSPGQSPSQQLLPGIILIYSCSIYKTGRILFKQNHIPPAKFVVPPVSSAAQQAGCCAQPIHNTQQDKQTQAAGSQAFCRVRTFAHAPFLPLFCQAGSMASKVMYIKRLSFLAKLAESARMSS
jgi:hypothetical protein